MRALLEDTVATNGQRCATNVLREATNAGCCATNAFGPRVRTRTSYLPMSERFDDVAPALVDRIVEGGPGYNCGDAITGDAWDYSLISGPLAPLGVEARNGTEPSAWRCACGVFPLRA